MNSVISILLCTIFVLVNNHIQPLIKLNIAVLTLTASGRHYNAVVE